MDKIERNNQKFNQKALPWKILCDQIIGQVTSWVLQRREFDNLKGTNMRENWRNVVGMSNPARAPEMVEWSKPPLGHFKLNFDGSVLGCPGPAGFGGVIHNEQADLIFTYVGPIGLSDSTSEELHGLYNGLKLFKQKKEGALLVEGDS
ncbi:uncharacterized protein [Aristolochia californica]|uniref:uncharacterized protein n=1 Tax=Aristolochia californica TaxID=171875 RepID=UPI0035DED992